VPTIRSLRLWCSPAEKHWAEKSCQDSMISPLHSDVTVAARALHCPSKSPSANSIIVVIDCTNTTIQVFRAHRTEQSCVLSAPAGCVMLPLWRFRHEILLFAGPQSHPSTWNFVAPSCK